MSITKAAELVRAHGRGRDSQLMHVTPSELNALQGIARAKGGSLTINPNTGLPEAGFLEDVLPTIAGTVIGSAVGMPWLGAAIGGLGTYALTGSLEKGLMSGLGAFGGASALSSLGSVGATAGAAGTGATSTAATAAGTSIAPVAEAFPVAFEGAAGAASGAASGAGAGLNSMQLAGAYDAGLSGVGSNLMSGAERFAGMGVGDKFSAIGSGIKQLATDPSATFKALPKGFLGDVGMAAAPIVGGIMDSSSSSMPEPEETPGYIRPSVWDPKTQRYTSLEPVKQSQWGDRSFQGYASSLGYAEGGEIEQRYERPVRTVDPAVTDYNNAMMQRAQQEYVQGMKFPVTPPVGIAAAAPATTTATTVAPGPGGMIYNPATQTFTPAAPTKSEIDKLREELMAMQPQQQSYGYDSGHGGANAKGGQIKRYAQGGIMSIPKFQAGGEMSSDAFVIPADVVSALGNGSTDAGVKILNNYLGVAMRIEGEGDGLSDDIPASIEGSQPARVADGEVYVPPDVVARLGEGDPEEGAEKLYEMIDSIRQSAHGKKSQQREVSPDQVMPE